MSTNPEIAPLVVQTIPIYMIDLPLIALREAHNYAMHPETLHPVRAQPDNPDCIAIPVYAPFNFRQRFVIGVIDSRALSLC